MLLVSISYYDNIVMLTITIMITIDYHDNQLLTTITQLYLCYCLALKISYLKWQLIQPPIHARVGALKYVP